MKEMTQEREIEQLKENIRGKLKRHFGRLIEEASELEIYKAAAMCVRDEIMGDWLNTNESIEKNKKKMVFYLSLEFLTGSFFKSNLIALNKLELYTKALAGMGVDIDILAEAEPDPGLGNGGLGRLAACFMESLSTLSLPAMGCGIRYDYGLFRQRIVDGQQIEMPDNWLADGCIWEVPRPEEQFEIDFYGSVKEYYDEFGNMRHSLEGCTKVLAMPYDIPIAGYKSHTANTLRIWSARSPVYIDMSYFGKGDYIRASAEKELAETISRVLYPDDSHNAGKSLRLQQQYFFTSATLQYIVKRHKELGLDIRLLPDYVAVQINDTHPSIAIAELMRLLVDVELLPWEEAFDICSRIFSYTNHTVMSEALECWPEYLIQNLLPRIYMIIKELNRRFCANAQSRLNDLARVSDMAVIAYNQVRMANLCMSVCHKVNGVSKLHTEILKNRLFKDFNALNPSQIVNITNGITPRRWLLQANPELFGLISEALGNDSWINDMPQIAQLEAHIEERDFRDKFELIKKRNKLRFIEYIKRQGEANINPDSIFDVQVKRMHEYKRQLLNVLNILAIYFDIVDNKADRYPRTFIFGAKASPGYVRAKQVITLINAVKGLLESNPLTKDRLKIIFVENYGVSNAQIIIPAADVSEQISLAGKEASGTGNMKLMMNGALTIGTMDGANVEMYDLLGSENMFIFGMSAHEAEGILRYGGYDANKYYSDNHLLKRAVDALTDGTLGSMTHETAGLRNYLLNGEGADPYFCLKDFDSYYEKQAQLEEVYKDREQWIKKAIINVSRSHYFTSDRSIEEYNQKIWKLSRL